MRKLPLITLLLTVSCLPGLGQEHEKPSCPTVVVIGQSAFPGPGRSEDFSVEVKGLIQPASLQYFWTVEPKRNFTGQGTMTIKVDFLNYGAVTATATVEGLPVGCPNTAAETYIVDPAPQAKKIGTLTGHIADEALIARIVERLSEQPYSMLFVIMNFDLRTSAKKMSADRIRLVNQLKKAKIALEMVRFNLANIGKHGVTFWLVPQGAKPPSAEN